MKRFASLQG